VEASASATADHMAVTGCDGFQRYCSIINAPTAKLSQKIRSFYQKPSLKYAA
jgi:hypothetical protein